MPNHVANVIKMEGIKNLPLFSVDDDGKQYFDFTKLIPMPESLNVESGSSTDESIVYFPLKNVISLLDVSKTAKRR